MSADLRLTPTRLALLQAVADGKVHRSRWSTSIDYLAETEARWRTVTAKVSELARVGWVQLDGDITSAETWRTYWRLTDLGRSVLDQANGGTP